MGDRRTDHARRPENDVGLEAEVLTLREANMRLSDTVERLLKKEERRTAREAEHRRKITELERLATKDKDTGLLNRRGFDEAMERYMTGVARGSASPATLVFIDFDRFKPINDLFSHAVGDTILMKIGGCLKRILRPNDYIARVGGDEFVLVLKNVGTREVAEHVIEKVRNALRAITIDNADPEQLELLYRAIGRRHLLEFSAGYYVIENAQLGARNIEELAEHDVPKYCALRPVRGEYVQKEQ